MAFNPIVELDKENYLITITGARHKGFIKVALDRYAQQRGFEICGQIQQDEHDASIHTAPVKPIASKHSPNGSH